MNIFSKKRIAVLCVFCLIICMVSGFTNPSAGADAGTAAASGAKVIREDTVVPAKDTVPVYMNGIKIADGFRTGNTVCIGLSDFYSAAGYQADIAKDAQSGAYTLLIDGLTLTAAPGQAYVTMNDRCFYVPGGLILKDGVPALPVRTLALSLQYETAWDAETSSVSLTADEPAPLESAAAHYNEQDLYWLAHIINAEAGNQPFEGKIGVGNVVMNRVADPTCPNTIHDVVFDSRFGVQFSVVSTGGIYADPNVDSVAAAKACLEGANVVGNALYFVNPTIASSKWFDQTRTFIAAIGEHDFYA